MLKNKIWSLDHRYSCCCLVVLDSEWEFVFRLNPLEEDDASVVIGDGVNLFSMPVRIYWPFAENPGFFLFPS